MMPETVPAKGQHVLWDLVQTAHVAQRRLTEVFADLGLTPAQYGVLASLADGDDLSQAELARAVLVRPQSLAAVIDTLVGAGLVRRGGPRGRGRRQALSLSDRGRELVAAARPAAYRLLRPEVTGLDPEQSRELAAMLTVVRQHLTQAVLTDRGDAPDVPT